MLNDDFGWPLHLVDLAPTHVLLKNSVAIQSRNRITIDLATLFSTNPVVLLKFRPTEKATELTFAHRDPQFASLRATVFLVSEDNGGDKLVVHKGDYLTLDIGHHLIEASKPLPDEHRRFKPFAFDLEAAHEGKFPVHRKETVTANTLACGLAGADENPHGFYAYTDMGDGGARVFYDRKLGPPSPTTEPDEKAFWVDSIPETPQAGRAWVRLAATDFVDIGLSGYIVPQQTPSPSLGSSLEQQIDSLAAAVTLGSSRSGTVTFRPNTDPTQPASVASIKLDREDVDEIEGAAAVPQVEPILSRTSRRFRVSLEISPVLRFASTSIKFVGNSLGIPVGAVGFTWTFSDGTAATGSSFTRTFAATQYDPSSAGPVTEDADPLSVTMTATTPDVFAAPNGPPSRPLVRIVRTSFPLAASLWATLWSAYLPFRKPEGESPDGNKTPGFFVRTATLDLLKYNLVYETSEAGEGKKVNVTYKNKRAGRYRFVKPSVPGQGDTEYELPIDVTLSGVTLTGDFGSLLGWFVKIDKVVAQLLCTQRYQACVQTSDCRDDTDSSENAALGHERNKTMVPSALCCLPAGEVIVKKARQPKVTATFTDLARNLTLLVAALVAVGLALVVISALLPLLIVLFSGGGRRRADQWRDRRDRCSAERRHRRGDCGFPVGEVCSPAIHRRTDCGFSR